LPALAPLCEMPPTPLMAGGLPSSNGKVKQRVSLVRVHHLSR
jgi:hypothetical protein